MILLVAEASKANLGSIACIYVLKAVEDIVLSRFDRTEWSYSTDVTPREHSRRLDDDDQLYSIRIILKSQHGVL